MKSWRVCNLKLSAYTHVWNIRKLCFKTSNVSFDVERTKMLITSTTKTIALCSLSNLINAADRAIMPIAILQMAPEFKWNMHDQGWILSAFPLGYFSSQVGKKE